MSTDHITQDQLFLATHRIGIRLAETEEVSSDAVNIISKGLRLLFQELNVEKQYLQFLLKDQDRLRQEFITKANGDAELIKEINEEFQRVDQHTRECIAKLQAKT